MNVNDKTVVWRRIAGDELAISFNECGIARIDEDGKEICLVKTPDGLRACGARCPHAGADLANGYTDGSGRYIICPVHNYRFSLVNGRDRDGEGYFMKIYPVKTTEEGIFIGLPV